MKKINIIICLSIFCLLLSSCSKEKPIYSEDVKNDVSVLKLVTGIDGIWFPTPASTSDGMYKIEETNIIYTDYSSATEVYLCSDINCTHLDNNCNSYIETGSGAMLFTNGEYLFSLIIGSNESNCTIVKMNFDGTGKTTILELPSSESISSAIATTSNMEYLYFLHDVPQTVENQGVINKRYFARLNILSGEVKDLCIIDLENSYLLGGYEDLILLKTLGGNGEEALITLNIQTGKADQIKAWKTGELVGDASEGGFYYIKNKKLFSIDIRTRGEKEISKSIPYENSEELRRIGIYDNRLVVRTYNKNGRDKYKSYIVGVDITTGEASRVSLKYINGIDEQPMLIVAEGAEEFIIVSNIQLVEKTFFTPEGGSYNSIIENPIESLIIKSDFWNGVENMRPVEGI